MFIQRMPLVAVPTAGFSISESLIDAMNNGDLKKVREFLGMQGVDSNAKGDGGCTVLMLAVKAGSWDIVDVILDDGRVDVNIQDAKGRTALMYSVISDDEDSLEIFLDKMDERDIVVDLNLRNNDGQSALILAAANGSVGDVRLLLDKEVNVNVVDHWGSNALMNYIAGGHGEVDAEVVQWFVENDVDLSCRDIYGRTALMLFSGQSGWAAKKDFLRCEGVLYDIDVFDGDGYNALMHAIVGRDFDHFHLLVRAGADVNASVAGGWSATALAKAYGDSDFLDLVSEVNHSHDRLSDID